MISTRKITILCGVIVAVTCIMFAALWQTGFIATNQSVFGGKGLEPAAADSDDTAKSNQSFLSLLFYLMNETEDIPGVEKLTMQFSSSNDSVSDVENQYSQQMNNSGYTFQPEYSDAFTQYSHTISFKTYTRGLTGVVVFVSAFLERTWVCYVTGSVFDLLGVYSYIVTYGYI